MCRITGDNRNRNVYTEHSIKYCCLHIVTDISETVSFNISSVMHMWWL